MPPPETHGAVSKKKLLACLGGAWQDYGPLQPVVEETSRRTATVWSAIIPGRARRAHRGVSARAGRRHRKRPRCRASASGISTTAPTDRQGRTRRPEAAPMHHTGVALAAGGLRRPLPRRRWLRRAQQRGKLNGATSSAICSRCTSSTASAWPGKTSSTCAGPSIYIASRPEVDGAPPRLLRPLDGLHPHLARRPLGAAAEGARRQLLPAHLRGDGAHRPDPLLPQLHPRLAPVRRHARHRRPHRPAALHLNFGETDNGSPIEEVKKAVEVIRRAYASKKAEDRFSYYIEAGAGHVLSDEMASRMKAHFAKYLA